MSLLAPELICMLLLTPSGASPLMMCRPLSFTCNSQPVLRRLHDAVVKLAFCFAVLVVLCRRCPGHLLCAHACFYKMQGRCDRSSLRPIGGKIKMHSIAIPLMSCDCSLPNVSHVSALAAHPIVLQPAHQ